MTRGVADCHFCGEPIDNLRTAWRKVEGWEKRRIVKPGHSHPQGGLNALALRVNLDVWAHSHCVERQKHGVHFAQETLA